MSSRSMRPTRIRAPLCRAIAAALGVFSLGAHALTVTAPNIDDARVVLPSGVYAPTEPGVELLRDYGSFQLFRVDAAHALELRAVGGRALGTPVSDTIEFKAQALDPHAAVEAAVPAAFAALKGSGTQLQLVQFAGPVAPEWLEELDRLGARPVQYLPSNAYAVLADDAAIERLARWVRSGGPLQFTAPYAPYYKLSGALAAKARTGLSGAKPLPVTVLIAAHDGDGATRSRIAQLAQDVIENWSPSKELAQIRISVAEADLAAIAQLPDVFAIEAYVAPHRMDEVQSQIVAGNLTGAFDGPSGPGYFDFLAQHGFSTTPGDYPIVDVADDGLGNGNAAAGAGDSTLTLNGAGVVSRVQIVNNCSADAAGDGLDGHGHLNTNIVGGYDHRVGFPYVDPLGYLRGLGINPYARLTHTKIFATSGFSLTKCSGSIAGLVAKELAGGAAISSNSWGANTAGDYDADSRSYDIATRDANGATSGTPPMIFVFAAGNAGSGTATVGSPGTAKNVITVGASESKRPSDEDGLWSDGCGVPSTGADNAMDVINFSSRGPASDNRVKPDVIAPGTHIQGTASTSPSYNGSGVCDFTHPGGQTTFAASSGTSHSTPAVAGMSSLVYYWLQNHFADATPSAAAVKAYLIAHPTYLTGVSANDTLPSNNQGYGMPNLGNAFDGTSKIVLDQATRFTAAGQNSTLTATVADPTKPVRIVMAFSDAPGSVSGSAIVNNLNLSVTVGGNTYLGNHFSGQWSTTGGTADAANNTEAVFLPAGTTGPISVTVSAATIAGDGVPSASGNDQDFALVCTNCGQTDDFALATTRYAAAVCGAAGASWDIGLTKQGGFANNVTLSLAGAPGGATPSFTPNALTPSGNATLSLTTAGIASGTYPMTINASDGTITHSAPIGLSISAAAAAAPALSAPAAGTVGVSVNPTFSWSATADTQSYTLEVSTDPAFGTINYTATTAATSHVPLSGLAPNTTYYWRVKSNNLCGGTASAVRSFVTNALTCQTLAAASPQVPKTISGSGTPTITSTLSSAVSGTLGDVDVLGLVGTHSWINDLDFKLTSPSGKTIQVMRNSCSNEDNFNLNLDDAAAGSPGGWPCPPVGGGTYKPSNPLIGFANTAANGTWTLTVHDRASGDGGSLTGWGLRLCTQSAPVVPVVANADAYSTAEDTPLTVAVGSGVLVNDSPSSGLTASVVSQPSHGTLSLNTNGSFLYTPGADYFGGDSFVYQASDGSNTSNATVTLTVTAVNDAPVAAGDAYVVNEDTTLNVAAPGVLGNDSDVDSANLTAVLVSGPAHGSLSLNADGSFGYTGDSNYCGADGFTYKANDGSLNSGVASVGITVNCINDAPVAAVDSYSVGKNTALTVPAPGVLGNDTDVDSANLSAVLVGGAAHGSLALAADGGFTYTPDHDYCGPDAFSYKANDGSLSSATTSAGISVTCSNTAPSANADSIAVNQGATATILVGGATSVLANDSDPENDTLSAVLMTAPLHGNLTLNPDGSFSYTHDGGTATSDSFAYQASDGSLASTTTIVSIVINLAPLAGCSVPAQLYSVGDNVSLTLSGLFSDPEAQALSFDATGLPAGLNLGAADALLSGTVAAGAQTGSPYTVSITATDAGGATLSRNLGITVLGSGDLLFRHGFDDPADASACR